MSSNGNGNKSILSYLTKWKEEETNKVKGNMSKETEEQLRQELDCMKKAKLDESMNALEKLVRESYAGKPIQEVVIEMKECYQLEDSLKQVKCDALVTTYFNDGEMKTRVYKQHKGKWFY